MRSWHPKVLKMSFDRVQRLCTFQHARGSSSKEKGLFYAPTTLASNPKGSTNSHTLTVHQSHLVSLCFFMYFVAQFPHGRFPSHFVFLARQRSQLAQSAMASFRSSRLSSSAILLSINYRKQQQLISNGSYYYVGQDVMWIYDIGGYPQSNWPWSY